MTEGLSRHPHSQSTHFQNILKVLKCDFNQFSHKTTSADPLAWLTHSFVWITLDRWIQMMTAFLVVFRTFGFNQRSIKPEILFFPPFKVQKKWRMLGNFDKWRSLSIWWRNKRKNWTKGDFQPWNKWWQYFQNIHCSIYIYTFIVRAFMHLVV